MNNTQHPTIVYSGYFLTLLIGNVTIHLEVISVKNNNYVIREIKKDEIDYANNLLNQLIIDEKNYDENINENYIVNNYYQNRQDDSILLVALLNNEIVAYLFGYIINAPVYLENKVILDALYVSNEHRKKGLANLLITNFKNWCLKRDIKFIELTVCSKNSDAYNLYKKHGFNVEKYIMNIKMK